MSKGQVAVLGINGHIGQAVARAFVAAGWEVAGMGRADRHHIPGVRFVRGDSDSVEDMRRAIGDADVVVNALNMRYDLWFEGRMEAQMARVVEAMGKSGKTMLFPGNIYNYSAADRVIAPDTPQRPQTVRGELRVRVEAAFEAAAARGDIQVIILRAGEFYGPGSSLDWFDQIMFREIRSGVVRTMGYRDVPHAWAYLPDLARAFESVASVRSTLGLFERFHFAGHFVTPARMRAAIEKAAPVKVRVRPFPIALLIAAGLVDPVIREIAKMRYTWKNPMELRDRRLESILGDSFGTPFDEAVAATVKPIFDRLRNDPKGAGKLAAA
ncbi:MAG TPA: NAD-dependent epimerase/dehydratase family protein [Devosia sp.]|nr:NAD-dependent epimerase/dehydratase family protein [Devosia sp.]